MVLLLVTLGCLAAGGPDEGQTRIDCFETRVRPVLVAHYYGCQSADAKRLSAGLRLDTALRPIRASSAQSEWSGTVARVRVLSRYESDQGER